MRRTIPLFSLLLSLLFLFLHCASVSADLPRWDTAAQGKLVTALAADTSGHFWVGTEERGVWEADGAGAGAGWKQFGTKDGLGKDDVTALVCDTKGRVWAGHRSAGVSVFNGQTWKSYDQANGPLGGHVFALAVSPKDGDVWMATDAGLTRYSLAKDVWRDYSRADGLPSDQIEALAFDPKGTLYAGTQGDGLAVGAVPDDYGTWKHLIGPSRPSPFATGSGFPDNRITALLVARDGSVYAGTPSGLAGSQDGGKSWNYLRGANWYAKVLGQTSPVPAGLAPSSTPTLSEDYVSALAEDGAGRLWVGHSAAGVEAADTAHPDHALTNIFPQPNTTDVRCLLAPIGPSVLVGGYGSGLAVASSTDPSPPAWPAPSPAPAAAALPTPAAAPTVAALKALQASVPAAAPLLKPGEAAYLGDDWQTQGDWVGHYGRQYALLFGLNSPGSSVEASEAGYEADDGIGPHHKSPNSPYTFIAKASTPERRFLYSPSLGLRRDCEVNDGSWQGGKYPLTYEGPDLWITFTVPAGPHRAAFYFVNNDGHQAPYRRRNYRLEMKADGGTLADEDKAPALASARVTDFYQGVYKQFLVMGPGTFHLKVGRANSECTKMQAVFLDRLTADPASSGAVPVVNAPTGPGYLGIHSVMRSFRKNSAAADRAVVMDVQPDSPARTAGFQHGDVLVSVGGEPVTGTNEFAEIVRHHPAGETIAVVVQRGTKRLTLTAKLTSLPSRFMQATPGPHSLPPAYAVFAPAAVPPATPGESEGLTAARALWAAEDAAAGRTGAVPGETRGRVSAYRAALAASAPAALLANWRWQLNLWPDTDRAEFASYMQKAKANP